MGIPRLARKRAPGETAAVSHCEDGGLWGLGTFGWGGPGGGGPGGGLRGDGPWTMDLPHCDESLSWAPSLQGKKEES